MRCRCAGDVQVLGRWYRIPRFDDTAGRAGPDGSTHDDVVDRQRSATDAIGDRPATAGPETAG